MSLKLAGEKMFESSQKLISVLTKHGYQAVYAGGCVRDIIMGKVPHDIDIATAADPDTVESIFKSEGYRTIPVGKSFGVIVVLCDDIEFEIATFRSDGNYTDGRRPDSVIFSSIEEDCRRRDFTINGMYYDPIREEIIDLVGGKKDIEDGIIRFIGNPIDRITEDHLRLIRAARFAARFDFTFHKDTWEAIVAHNYLVVSVSAERITAELEKMFAMPNRKIAMQYMLDIGLFPVRAQINNVDIFNKLNSHPSVELCWAAYVMGARSQGLYDFEAILKDHRLSKHLTQDVFNIIKTVREIAGDKTMAYIKRFFRNSWWNDVLELAEILEIDVSGISAYKDQAYDKEFISPVPLITGTQLIEMGLNPGPRFKSIIETVETHQLNGEISDHDEAMKIVNSLILEI